MPITNLSLLQLLEKVWSDSEVDTRITVSDVGMQIEILHSDAAFTLEPVVGDVTRVGIVIKTTCETGKALPLATGYTLRLVCTNGSTIRVENKDPVRFSSDWRCTMERRINEFTAGLRGVSCYGNHPSQANTSLETAYSRIVDAELDDVQFYNLYRQAQYLSRGVASRSEQIDTLHISG